jgi:hypothetical protein
LKRCFHLFCNRHLKFIPIIVNSRRFQRRCRAGLNGRGFNCVCLAIILRRENGKRRNIKPPQDSEEELGSRKVLKKARWREPGLINACNVSRVKSEGKDADEEEGGREIIKDGPLFAPNVFIDWKRLFPGLGNNARTHPKRDLSPLKATCPLG